MCSQFLKTLRFYAKSHTRGIHVAVVGSGPSGFYTTQYLLKNKDVKVDIYEKFPIPFGLIRFGVAPDHQEVKNVINSFTVTGLHERVAFYGNVSVGKDVTLQQLRKAYNVVVLCYGTAKDRTLDIEGEYLPNVLAARRFVGWYNGVPEDSDLKVNLNTENVVIIGQGNVAIDCARILLSPVEDVLQKTDITSHAVNGLKNSKVKKVYVVGRRGIVQVAFTIKEFREITKLNGCQTIVSPDDCKHVTEDIIKSFQRPRKRLTEFIIKVANTKQSPDSQKQCIVKFCRSPLKIMGNETDGVKSVLFGVNHLEDGLQANAKAVLTDKTEEIECGLVLKSIGYKAVSIDSSIPMDERRGVIKNESGRVNECGKGLYCSGWAATGATGVILTTMNSSFTVAKTILDDIEADEELRKDCRGSGEVIPIITETNKDVVTFKDWQRVDELEKSLGVKSGKPREKFVSESDILKVIKKS